MNQLTALSPLDGRYAEEVKKLIPYFSEMALMKYRLMIEVEYLIALGNEKRIEEFKKLGNSEIKKLRNLYINFSLADAERVKKIEKTTNHDVKSVEYFIKEKVAKTSLAKNMEFIHFGLTSEDTSNLANSLMLKNGLKIYFKYFENLIHELKKLALANRSIPLLSLTHGQPASPTTIGKEIAIFYNRLTIQANHLKQIELLGKFSGAVGNWHAQAIAYPDVDWINFSKKFVESLGLKFNPLTTQIEPHDSLAEIYHNLIRINNIIKNLNDDIWLYVSRGIFKQKKITGEIGSSTMPHKINPWKFENSDGNLNLANAILETLANKLTISRLQRDLSDSTTLRNQGIAIGYTVLAIKSTLNGLSRLAIDKTIAQKELNEHWEVLAEAIQTVLRKCGHEKPYEKLKGLTRGEKISKNILQNFIKKLDIPKNEKQKLLKLTPATYTGLSSKLVSLIPKT